MASSIAVEDLRAGIFIQLDGGWLSHPFGLSNFRIAAPKQIQTLRGLGLKRVRWAPEKSDRPESREPAGVDLRPGPRPGRSDPARDDARQRAVAARAILDKLLGSREVGVRLVAGGAARAAAHALNWGVISMLIARTLGVPEPDLLELDLQALHPEADAATDAATDSATDSETEAQA